MDLALQRAERLLSASPSDPETYQRWVGEWIRSGGRDPRREPRAGDVVEDARRVSGPRTVIGSWPMQLRSRVEVFGPVDDLLVAVDGPVLETFIELLGGGTRRAGHITLPEGTLVRHGVRRESDGRTVFRSHFDARMGSHSRGWHWVRVDGYYDVLAHLARAVGARAAHPIYLKGDRSAEEWTAREAAIGGTALELSSWRSWAKGGTVLRVAR